MGCTGEWITSTVAVLRVGPGHYKYGDPYEFVCVVKHNYSHAWISAAAGKYNRETRKVIWLWLDLNGIKTVEWERRNNKQRNISRKV